MPKRKGYYIFPNVLTAGNIFFGFLSIVNSTMGEFYKAALFIIVAAVMDGLDGKVARFTGSESRFGLEFDSLADVVSFGVAPAILLYLLYFEPFSRIGVAFSFLFLASGALRLARFNTMSKSVSSAYFSGLPIPAAAMAIAASVLLSKRINSPVLGSPPFYFLVTFTVSVLMVSNIRYFSFKKLGFFRDSPWRAALLIIVALTLLLSEPEPFIFVTVFGYVVSGPLICAREKLLARKTAEEKELRDESQSVPPS